MLKNIMTDDECVRMKQLITKANNIVLCCHTSPDGDAIGSCLGLADFLKAIGKQPEIIVPNKYPDFLSWLPGNETIRRYDKKTEEADSLIDKADLIFCLDFNAVKRVDEMSESLQASQAHKILLDHHLDPELDGDIIVSHPEMCSTSEIVFRVISQLDGFDSLTHHGAVSLYCGMMTDTGGFTYNSTSPDIYLIISQLLTKGIDKDKIYRNVYNNYSYDRFRLMGHILLNKLVYCHHFNAAYFTMTKKEMMQFHFIKGDAEGLVNIPLQIKGMKLSISLREDTEKDHVIRVSLRSVDDFPCNMMSEKFFNGGGHLNASGGELHCTIDQAVEVVKRALVYFEKELK
jgi:bifunctional oligoribonuclease and PAP phosphatase NrnA